MFIKTDCCGYINTEHVRRIYIQRDDGPSYGHVVADMGYGEHIIIETYYDSKDAEDGLRFYKELMEKE